MMDTIKSLWFWAGLGTGVVVGLGCLWLIYAIG